MIIDRMLLGAVRRWLLFFNLAVAVYIGLPMAAPALMEAGMTRSANLLYKVYSPMCHQLASRSFFLFGEQHAYPRALAGTSLRPIEEYMPGIPEFARSSPDPAVWGDFLLAARAFRGNLQMGYKIALCQRDLGIYLSLLAGGLIYGVLRRFRKIRPMPFWLFVILGLGPVAVDGFSQLLSQLFVGLGIESMMRLFPLRESTPFLRVLTGAIMGLSIAWLILPRLNEQFAASADDIERRIRTQSGES